MVATLQLPLLFSSPEPYSVKEALYVVPPEVEPAEHDAADVALVEVAAVVVAVVVTLAELEPVAVSIIYDRPHLDAESIPALEGRHCE